MARNKADKSVDKNSEIYCIFYQMCRTRGRETHYCHRGDCEEPRGGIGFYICWRIEIWCKTRNKHYTLRFPDFSQIWTLCYSKSKVRSNLFRVDGRHYCSYSRIPQERSNSLSQSETRSHSIGCCGCGIGNSIHSLKAVMCKPHRCPHVAYTGSVCLYCAGGPDSDFEYSTQSYTGYEPTRFQTNRFNDSAVCEPFGAAMTRTSKPGRVWSSFVV